MSDFLTTKRNFEPHLSFVKMASFKTLLRTDDITARDNVLQTMNNEVEKLEKELDEKDEMMKQLEEDLEQQDKDLEKIEQVF